MVTTALLPERPIYVAGRWYQPLPQLLNTGGALVQNSIRMVPFYLVDQITVAALATRITTLFAGNIQLAIYASDPSTGKPTGTAMAATGDISVASTGMVSANLGASVLLYPGLYWMAVNADNSTVAAQAYNGAASVGAYLIGSATLANVDAGATTASLLWIFAQTYGTWPDLTAASLTESTGTSYAVVLLKAA